LRGRKREDFWKEKADLDLLRFREWLTYRET
jgi:hypothetical protein